jgi:hypothetical protein
MTTATLVTLVLVGFAVGLFAQFLTVYRRLEPEHSPLSYLGMGAIGVAGALSSIPIMMLLDYGRGSTGAEALHLIGPGLGFVYATAIALFAKWLELGDKRARFFLLVALSLAKIALILLVMHGRIT